MRLPHNILGTALTVLGLAAIIVPTAHAQTNGTWVPEKIRIFATTDSATTVNGSIVNSETTSDNIWNGAGGSTMFGFYGAGDSTGSVPGQVTGAYYCFWRWQPVDSSHVVPPNTTAQLPIGPYLSVNATNNGANNGTYPPTYTFDDFTLSYGIGVYQGVSLTLTQGTNYGQRNLSWSGVGTGSSYGTLIPVTINHITGLNEYGEPDDHYEAYGTTSESFSVTMGVTMYPYTSYTVQCDGGFQLYQANA